METIIRVVKPIEVRIFAQTVVVTNKYQTPFGPCFLVSLVYDTSDRMYEVLVFSGADPFNPSKSDGGYSDFACYSHGVGNTDLDKLELVYNDVIQGLVNGNLDLSKDPYGYKRFLEEIEGE